MSMQILQPGDPCPCCGQPIKTDDPEKLWLLTVIAMQMEERGAYPPCASAPQREQVQDRDEGGRDAWRNR